ncbi:hypothetical protein WN48_09906 [Eufriesea mexicana]|nr:hypothetical protein WN48_09906 [Eufriesea mexicana]
MKRKVSNVYRNVDLVSRPKHRFPRIDKICTSDKESPGWTKSSRAISDSCQRYIQLLDDEWDGVMKEEIKRERKTGISRQLVARERRVRPWFDDLRINLAPPRPRSPWNPRFLILRAYLQLEERRGNSTCQVEEESRGRWLRLGCEESGTSEERKREKGGKKYSREEGKERQDNGVEYGLLGEDTMFLELSATWPSSGAASRFS